jgi:hypothetical protein
VSEEARNLVQVLGVLSIAFGRRGLFPAGGFISLPAIAPAEERILVRMTRKKSTWPNPWLMVCEAALLAAEAHGVIALRLARLARGGRPAETEAARMIIEKGAAFLAANTAAAAALSIGGVPLAADIVIATYRRSVRANHRRLSRQRVY